MLGNLMTQDTFKFRISSLAARLDPSSTVPRTLFYSVLSQVFLLSGTSVFRHVLFTR